VPLFISGCLGIGLVMLVLVLLGLGLVSSGLGLGLVTLVLVLRILSCLHHSRFSAIDRHYMTTCSAKANFSSAPLSPIYIPFRRPPTKHPTAYSIRIYLGFTTVDHTYSIPCHFDWLKTLYETLRKKIKICKRQRSAWRFISHWCVRCRNCYNGLFPGF